VCRESYFETSIDAVTRELTQRARIGAFAALPLTDDFVRNVPRHVQFVMGGLSEILQAQVSWNAYRTDSLPAKNREFVTLRQNFIPP
jgi:hypothetical protein